MNVFDCALKIEEEVRQYYEGLKAESTDPEIKNLFSLLAASEEEHRKNLLRLKGSVATAARAEMAALDGAGCSYRPSLTQRELLEETARDPGLYRHTVQEEEKEIRFYEELAAAARNEETRKSLRMLAEEERRHLATVENIYEFVEAPKTFLEWGEFSNLRRL